MNKKFWIAVIAIFVLWMAIDYVVHGLLLNADYSHVSGVYRTHQDSMNYFPYMLLAHALMAVAFVWIYLQGKENKPFLPQGIRYAVAVAVLTTIPMALIYYAVHPLPGMLVFKQIVLGTISLGVLGIAVAWLNK
jgi:hypothetical protein